MGRPAARIPPESVAAIIVNAKLAAQQMVKALSHSPAKVFVIHNDLKPQAGRDRERAAEDRELDRNGHHGYGGAATS